MPSLGKFAPLIFSLFLPPPTSDMHSRSTSSRLRKFYSNRKKPRRLVFTFFLSCLAFLVLCSLSPINFNFADISVDEDDIVHAIRPNKHDFSNNVTITTTTPRPPRILLVSALYRLAYSKHSDSDYTDWLKHFLGQISTDVYFFTSPDLSSLVRSSRPSTLPLYLNTTFQTPFSVPPLHNLSSVYTTQHEDLDPEKSHHSPELYAVWNAKPYLVTQAIENLERQGKTYDYVFWNDAGSFRYTHWYDAWPDPGRVEQVWEEAVTRHRGRRDGVEKKDLVFFPIAGFPWFVHRWWKERHGPLQVDFSEGSFFGGSPSAMHWFSRVFYTYHDHYLSRSLFIGKDQSIFNSLFLLFPDRFITMSSTEVTGMHINLDTVCCRQWWYYHFWFGSEQGGKKAIESWNEVMRKVVGGKIQSNTFKQKWKSWKNRMRYFWTGRLEVPSSVVDDLPPVLLMKSLLRRRFGWGWTPPVRYVHPGLDLL